MPRICFRHRESGRLVAQVEAEDLARIPATDDGVYAPSAADPGVYVYLLVERREFYYDQQGFLALVNLECVELPSQADAVPPRSADRPSA
jgi:hypothetical protein